MSIDNNSPGYVESVFSSKRKSKEDLQVKQLIPDGILDNIDVKDNALGIQKILESYYEFMNMNEFIYKIVCVERDWRCIDLDWYDKRYLCFIQFYQCLCN